MMEIFRYQTEDGKEPVTDWLQSLKDKQAQAKIRVRIKRLEAGNLVTVIRSVKVCMNYENTLALVIECISVAMARP